MDISTEQFASRLHLMMTNIRKGNPTGKSIAMALSMYQMHLGCEKSFLDLDPHFYPTLPNAMLSGQYFWDALVKIKGKLQIPEMWVPRSDVVND